MESYKEEDLMHILHSDHLSHYGIKGQKWGDRRFQNEDGSLTEEGKKRYGIKYNVSDIELLKAIKNIENKKKYVSIKTDPVLSKRSSLTDLIKTTTSTGEGITKLKSGYQISNLDAEKDAERISELKGDVVLAGKISKASEKSLASGIANFSTKKEYNMAKQKALSDISEMDEDELDRIVKRLDLEKRYDELVQPKKKSNIDRGREAIQLLGTAAALGLTILEIRNALKNKPVKHSDKDFLFLEHYGVRGMKKGVRRYQNEDGSLTPEGYRHYGIDPNSDPKKASAEVARLQRQEYEYEDQIKRYRTEQKLQKQARKEAFKERKQLAREDLFIQKMQADEALKEEKNQKKVTRKNIMKYAIGAAAIAGAVAIGASVIKNINLDRSHSREMEKLSLEGRNAINLKKAEGYAERYKAKQSLKGIKEVEKSKRFGMFTDFINKKGERKANIERTELKTRLNELLKAERERKEKNARASEARRKTMKRKAELAKTGAKYIKGWFKGDIK